MPDAAVLPITPWKSDLTHGPNAQCGVVMFSKTSCGLAWNNEIGKEEYNAARLDACDYGFFSWWWYRRVNRILVSSVKSTSRSELHHVDHSFGDLTYVSHNYRRAGSNESYEGE